MINLTQYLLDLENSLKVLFLSLIFFSQTALAIDSTVEEILRHNKENRKYRILLETESEVFISGRLRKVYRIEGIRSKRPGGWVESPFNLSPLGTSWVGGDAVVVERARVEENAVVSDHGKISGHALVKGNGRVSGHGKVNGYAIVRGNGVVSDDGEVSGHAVIEGSARVLGKAKISGRARLTERAWAAGYARVKGDRVVKGTVKETYLERCLNFFTRI